MKKIGIITILKTNNYGAELQAFALQKKLNLIGYNAEIIDYLFYKNKNHKREKISYPFYHFPFKKKIKEYILPMYEKIRSIPHYKELKLRNKGFEKFHEKYTKFSAQTYKSYSQLYDQAPDYDIYCVGSDQVWNPNCYTSLNPYFLTFAPKGKKRISYASSFGISSIPNNAKSFYRKGLIDLNAISVREKTGTYLIKELIGKEAKVVVDPTLLLTVNDWRNIANYSKVPNFQYILLYVLKDSTYITQIAQKLSKELDIKIVRICKGAFKQDKRNSGIINIIDAAPDDFIGLFSKAQYVLTNSFHGTVFSILFNKNFYTILKKGKDNNSRQIDLLNNLGIENRIIYESETIKTSTINYTFCNKQIEVLRKDSENYLINAIEK